MNAEYIVVITTAPSREVAGSIAQAVVGKRLAACAQITGPVSSTYWWKGVLESADEWRIEFKTRSELYPALEQAIKAVHPYDTPEIVAVPIGAGYDRYIAWLGNETAEHGA